MKRNTTKKLKRRSRFLLIAITALYIGSGLLVIAIYADILALNPSASENHTESHSACWQNQGSGKCMSIVKANTYRFFNVPIYLTFSGTSPVQYHEVILSSTGGSMSSSLADGLWYVEVSYGGAIAYDSRNTVGDIVGTSGLILQPSDTAGMDYSIGDSTALVGKSSSITWRYEGDYYPTVILNYLNGTSHTYSFEDSKIHVQSQSDYDNAISSKKNEVYVVIGATDAAAGAIYALQSRKE